MGYSKDENYIGSDSYALKSMTNKISYLDDGELCVLTKDQVSFYDQNLNKITNNVELLFNYVLITNHKVMIIMI